MKKKLAWVTWLPLCFSVSLVLAQEPSVQVERFTVNGNTLLSAAELDAVLIPYKGKRTLLELKQAAQAVQAAYVNAGYGAVIAYLPEQSGEAGTAMITVLEGKVAQIIVTSNKQFSEGNIRRSVPLLQEGQTPQVRRLDAQIQMANENPAKLIAVSLEPGKQQGEVLANVDVREQPTSRWSLSADNTGNKSTGHWRTTLAYTNAALWDRDHLLSLQAQTSPDHASEVRVLSANYRVPLYDMGLSLDAFAAWSSVDGGTSSTAVGPLQFSGSGRVLGLRVTQYLPRWQIGGGVDQRLIIGLDQRAYLNNCSIAGLPPGACGTAGESVAVQPISIEYTAQLDGEYAAGFNITGVHNLGLGGSHSDESNFEAVRQGAKKGYSILRVGAFATLGLPSSWKLQGRMNGQWSDDALVPGEQFGLGGASIVRAYQEREIIGDNGFAGALELVAPDWVIGSGTLRWLLFLDAGHIRNNAGMPCVGMITRCTLASAGLGLNLGAGPLQIRFSVGRALRDGADTERGDVRGHVQVNYSFL
jgi:hemolysin activation/secretion protein